MILIFSNFICDIFTWTIFSFVVIYYLYFVGLKKRFRSDFLKPDLCYFFIYNKLKNFNVFAYLYFMICKVKKRCTISYLKIKNEYLKKKINKWKSLIFFVKILIIFDFILFTHLYQKHSSFTFLIFIRPKKGINISSLIKYSLYIP